MDENVEQPGRIQKVKARFNETAENFKTNETVKRVRLHFAANKKTYIVGAIGAVAYASKCRPIRVTVSPVISPIFNNNNLPVFNNVVNNAGHLYKIVEDLETGEMTKKVTTLATKLAEEHDVAYETALRKLSTHLNHPDLVPHVFGKVYAIAGSGTTGS